MTRIELGYIALDEQTGRVHTGSLYSGGAKVYKSEGMARAAVKERSKLTSYKFFPAFIEVPDDWIKEPK